MLARFPRDRSNRRLDPVTYMEAAGLWHLQQVARHQDLTALSHALKLCSPANGASSRPCSCTVRLCGFVCSHARRAHDPAHSVWSAQN